MSLARALTTTVRRARGHSNEEPVHPAPVRAGTLKSTDFRYVDRAKISLPTALISSTSALVYDAPDLPRVPDLISPSISSASSRRSYEDSESGASSATALSTPTFSREPSPVLENKNNYFTAPAKIITEIPQTPLSSSFLEIEIPPTTPAVPSRSLSHTKHTHQTLATQRSNSRMSAESSASSRAVSGELLPIEAHPFGAELAQVMEVAEEFGVADVQIWDEEEQFLTDHGYGRFSAEDYINDIQPLFGKAFFDTPIPNIPAWL